MLLGIAIVAHVVWSLLAPLVPGLVALVLFAPLMALLIRRR